MALGSSVRKWSAPQGCARPFLYLLGLVLGEALACRPGVILTLALTNKVSFIFLIAEKPVSPKSGTLKSPPKGFDTTAINKSYYNVVSSAAMSHTS